MTERILIVDDDPGMQIALNEFLKKRGYEADSAVSAEEALERKQQLLKQLLDTYEGHRKLVAYEIHDGIAQYLAGAIMQFQSYEQAKDNKPAEAVLRFSEEPQAGTVVVSLPAQSVSTFVLPAPRS